MPEGYASWDAYFLPASALEAPPPKPANFGYASREEALLPPGARGTPVRLVFPLYGMQLPWERGAADPWVKPTLVGAPAAAAESAVQARAEIPPVELEDEERRSARESHLAAQLETMARRSWNALQPDMELLKRVSRGQSLWSRLRRRELPLEAALEARDRVMAYGRARSDLVAHVRDIRELGKRAVEQLYKLDALARHRGTVEDFEPRAMFVTVPWDTLAGYLSGVVETPSNMPHDRVAQELWVVVEDLQERGDTTEAGRRLVACEMRRLERALRALQLLNGEIRPQTPAPDLECRAFDRAYEKITASR